jgi:hypothetical protein
MFCPGVSFSSPANINYIDIPFLCYYMYWYVPSDLCFSVLDQMRQHHHIVTDISRGLIVFGSRTVRIFWILNIPRIMVTISKYRKGSSWSYGSWIYNYPVPMQTVPITTSVVSSNLHTGEFVLNTTPKCKKKKKGSNWKFELGLTI